MYWPPLYAFARRGGLDGHAAQDAVQGFLARLLERDDIARAVSRVLATWPAEAAAFSPDGRWLAVSAYAAEGGEEKRGVIFFDTTTWKAADAIPGHVPGFAWQGGALLLLDLGAAQLEWWTTDAAQPKRRVALPARVPMWTTPGFSADGRRVAIVRDGEPLSVHDTATGASVAEVTGVFSFLSLPLLSPDGRWLALGGAEEEIRLFDVDAPATAPRTLHGHLTKMHALRFTANGRTLASQTGNGVLRFWNVPTWSWTLVLPAHRSAAWPALWYAHENTPGILPPHPAFVWNEKTPPTRRQITEITLTREGPRTPFLRCFARLLQAGRVLNIDHGGAVHVSAADWHEPPPASPK